MKELKFSEILQKNINKINKKKEENLKYMNKFKVIPTDEEYKEILKKDICLLERARLNYCLNNENDNLLKRINKQLRDLNKKLDLIELKGGVK